jgi:hypothetical protein
MVNLENVRRVGGYAGSIATAGLGIYRLIQTLPVLPQFMHDVAQGITVQEVINRYDSAIFPSPISPFLYFIYAAGLLAIGRMDRLDEDWNSLKNFVGEIPNKISSEVINPIKKRIPRINTNYVAAMRYSGI